MKRPAERRQPSSGRRTSEIAQVANVRITHPSRVMYPEAGLTKLDVARYYERIAASIVPHTAGRPLTLVRCPTGLSEACFYMKHSKVWAPPALRRVMIQEKTKRGEYLIADSIDGIVSLVQMNVLEIHTWNTRFERVECPDRLVFDLDPGPEVAFPAVAAAARLVRRVLASIDLQSFPKTTGGRGLHVVVPLMARVDWSACLEFSRAFARLIEQHDPERFTTRFAKAGRERKVLVDYLRNNRTNTSIAAFSTRARPAAPVSVPLAWRELTAAFDPANFTVRTVPARLARLTSDPWAAYFTCRQALTPARIRAVTSGAVMAHRYVGPGFSPATRS